MNESGGRVVEGRARCSSHATVWMTRTSASEWACPVPGCGSALLLVRPVGTAPEPEACARCGDATRAEYWPKPGEPREAVKRAWLTAQGLGPEARCCSLCVVQMATHGR